MYSSSQLDPSGPSKFEEWTQEYGPVFSLRELGRTTIVVGRVQAAVDIMEKEGAALADRPLSIAAGETLSGGMRVVFTPSGDRLRRQRRSVSFRPSGFLAIASDF